MSRKHKRRNSTLNVARDETAQAACASEQQRLSAAELNWLLLAGVLCLVSLIWSYWPTLVGVVHQWNHQPDYSHGYLVLPVAFWFLWSRRSGLSSLHMRPSLWGAIALLFAGTVRVVAGRYYMTPLDGWTLPLTVAGLVWLLAGSRCLRWALPAIVFLWFMMPIPYSAEGWLRVPLQRVATDASTATLVTLGQPAIAEGNTIWLGEAKPLFVEEACSGLRILVGIFALAFAFVLFSRWSWWQKALVLMAALPIAMAANVVRIVATGLLSQMVSGKAAHVFTHDIAGFVMIPLAALMFWLFLIYLDKLFPEVEEMSGMSIRQAAT